ncbi:MAG: branched-chain amino acid ABC transporter permease [Candidatus Velthaea sp.]
MTLNAIALQLFTGVALGAIYVLLGVGLSLIFGMVRVVNFAHGAFYMLGAYAGVVIFGLTNNFWLALVGTPLLLGLLGLAVERFLVRRLYGRSIDYPILLTFALTYIFVDAVRIGFGQNGVPFSTPAVLAGAVNIGVGYFPLYRLFLIVVAALLLLALWFFIERTPYGLIMRAGARDPVILRVLGINVDRVWLMVFALGTGIAGLAGVLAAPMREVTPDMGQSVLIEAFVITVIGGMGSLVGAIVAGLLVGVVASMTTLFAPEMKDISMFALMALTLLVRPNGLFGSAEAEGMRPA